MLYRLRKAVDQHFTAEEGIMAGYSYPETRVHTGEHRDLSIELLELETGVLTGKLELSEASLDGLKKWLIEHALQSDRKLGLYLAENGISEKGV